MLQLTISLRQLTVCAALQLCQMCVENPDILLLKVDFDENREVVKPLGIKVRCYFPHLAKMLHAHQLLNEVASLSCHFGCQLASFTHIDR